MNHFKPNRIILSSAVATLMLLSACNEQNAPVISAKPAQVWLVEHSAITGDSHQYSGETVARKETNLSFRIDGKIIQRYVEVGDEIKRGQKIARLDNNDLELNVNNAAANLLVAQSNLQSNQGAWRAARAQLDAAKANMASARAELSNAQVEFRRTQKLVQQNFLSKAALDADTNRFRTAKANVRAAQAQINAATADSSSANAQINSAQAQIDAVHSQQALAQSQSSYTLLTSNVKGIVTDVAVESGEMVSAGQTIVKVAAKGDRDVEIQVGEDVIQQLTTGTEATITLWAEPDKEFKGKVREISPAADSNKTWSVKIALLDADPQLKLGLTAEVSFMLTPSVTGSWLPATSLFQKDKKPAVWLLNPESKAELQNVDVLKYQNNGIIVKGLKQGQKVVVAGVHSIYKQQLLTPIAYDGTARPNGGR